MREERRASAAANGGSPQADLTALLGTKPAAAQNGRRCEARPRVAGDPRLSVYEAPASPYGLIEEQLYDNPWKLLVACILLNKTSIAQVCGAHNRSCQLAFPSMTRLQFTEICVLLMPPQSAHIRGLFVSTCMLWLCPRYIPLRHD